MKAKIKEKDCAALILAEGQGTRLGALTGYFSKSAVFYGGDYRIIDFALSNCKHSRINTATVVVKQFSNDLHCYLGNGQTWDMKDSVNVCKSDSDENDCIETVFDVYRGMEFIEKLKTENVLLIPGNHVSKMDYGKIFNFHKKTNADATIVSTDIYDTGGTHKYRCLKTDEKGRIYKFDEKLKKSKGNTVSTGIYILKWSKLKKYMKACGKRNALKQDIEQNILNEMLCSGESLYAYNYDGYWKEIETVNDLWQSNMDLVGESPKLDIKEENWKIYTSYNFNTPSYISDGAKVTKSIVSGNCSLFGKVSNSIISDSVIVREGAEITDSVIMPNAYIGANVRINKAVIGPNAMIMDGVEIGAENGINFFTDSKVCTNDVSLLSPWVYIEKDLKFRKNSHIGITRFNFDHDGTVMLPPNRITCYVGNNC